MSLAIFFLCLSLFGLACSTLTVLRVRLPGGLTVPQFVVGWIWGELALQAIVGQIIITLFFVWGGVLESPYGQAGLVACGLSWTLLGVAHRRSLRAGEEIAQALSPLGIRPDARVSPFTGFFKPFGFRDPEVEVERHIEYGESLPGDQGGRNQLDVYRPKDAQPGDRRPVLLQIHGGGWIIGDKREQGIPLMTNLARRGWVCVTANYRLSPQATMPDHIIDVKRAIAWIRKNIESYGGDPDFVCITGGSAGGNLSSLAALTANDPRFQPGFEDVDTRLEACVPFYGVFDFVDRTNVRGKMKMADVIGPRVFKCTPEENPELWDSVSPIARIHSDAPPFFVVQGSHDTLVFSGEADVFVEALREKSNQPVLHVELEGAQHAFEIFHSVRTAHTVHGVTAFFERVHADHEAQRA